MNQVISKISILRIYVILENLLQRKPKATLKDIMQLCLCKESNNYEKMFKTKLYNNHTIEYCKLLEIISWYYEKTTKR